MLSPAQYYNQQKEHFSHLLAKTTQTGNRIAMLRLWVIIADIVLAIWVIKSHNSGYWWAVCAVFALFLVLVRIHQHLSEQKRLYQLHLSIIDNELKALEGDFSMLPDGGQFTDISHPYSYDLDIFGKGSVYQMLCRIVTIGGTTALAARLSSIILKKEQITERQEVVSELATLPDLLQQFRVAGSMEPEDPKDRPRLEKWLQEEDMFINSNIIRTLAVLMPALSVACIVYSVITGGLFPGFGLLVVINWTILGIFQKKIKPAIVQVGNGEQFIDKLEHLLEKIAPVNFKTATLQRAATNAKSSLVHIARFKSLIRLFDSRENVFLGPPLNSLFLFDLYCLLRLESWRKKHKDVLQEAINDSIDFDVYVSCAVYAFNNPGNTYPRITTTGTEITARNLRHPLLAPKTAIGNNVSIGRQEQFYLLTGANMTGKSTFIRTLGVSNVLCNTGLPLPAEELTMPLLDLYTSMRITDSVQDDISYFRAELNRIKTIMDKVRASPHPFLVLLDEPLRGTNSTDKQQGTRSIVETLLTFHAIGIVATHDTGLCDMEQNYPGKVSNYSFESKVEQNGLSFDFKLKPGGSTSNNATILMRQMGIIN
ncbi:MAG: hypothetical protein JWQ38_1584 [Flavipsychrobacter sp.]|nr:hypothetical protein [Flavipsychrobacter sp.]